ncbi:hypothetical protein ZIOFF_058935 [Zingiber officinale]|uniref:DUF4408 domain-containing protein n=1 Tax=Zingiber officinale TaxID=94328 RepID=A0A8J5FH89_ZINOF|nr:hypothetical protein ZIOFF_058935 [Zingiber officinale]
MWKGREEKETAMRRHRWLRQIGILLRCFEAASAVLLLSWSSDRAPAAARLTADFFRRLAAVLLSPRFVFLIGNAIVLLLFSKSHQRYSSHSLSASAADIYQEFLESRGSGGHLPCSQAPSSSPHEEAIYDDKEVCIETAAYQRSRSERMRRRRGARPGLRRAATDLGLAKGTKLVQDHEDEKAAEASDAEEFRRVVEAFIAKQTRFLREEECSAAVSLSPTPTLSEHHKAVSLFNN